MQHFLSELKPLSFPNADYFLRISNFPTKSIRMGEETCCKQEEKQRGGEHFLLKLFLACPAQGKEVAYSAVLNTLHVCRLNHHSRQVALKTWSVIGMYEKTGDTTQTIAQNLTSM